MVKEFILDQLVKDITSDHRSKDVRGLISPTGSEPTKLVEKKRKASALDFTPWHFKIKTKKTRSSGVPIASDPNAPREETPDEKLVEPVPEQVETPMPAQEPVAAPIAPLEAATEDKFQQALSAAGTKMVEVIDLEERISSVRKCPRPHNIPNQPRVFDDKRLEEAWKKVADCQSKTDSGTFYSQQVNKAIQHMYENVAMIGNLTQQIHILEKENSEFKRKF